jgi:hypothetical protein
LQKGVVLCTVVSNGVVATQVVIDEQPELKMTKSIQLWEDTVYNPITIPYIKVSPQRRSFTQTTSNKVIFFVGSIMFHAVT